MSEKTRTQSPSQPKASNIQRSVRYSAEDDKLLKIMVQNRNKSSRAKTLVVSDLIREAIEQYVENNIDDTGSRRSMKRTIHDNLGAINAKLETILAALQVDSDPQDDNLTMNQFLQLIHVYAVTTLHLQAHTLIPLLYKSSTATPPTPQTLLASAVPWAYSDQTLPTVAFRVLYPEDNQS
jgi:hypothetical protein